MEGIAGLKVTRLVAVVAVIGLMAAWPLPGARGATTAACPGVEFMTVDEVRALPAGTVGQGLTVARGRDPQPFQAEILGVLENGILPGRHMIVVETSSPAIDAAGGIWAGMSGSPVYVDGKLIGAVAYGLSFGPSAIGGLTPAEDMMKLLDRPAAGGATTRRASGKDPVAIDRRMRRIIARASGVSMDRVAGGFSRLKVPVAVSGGAVRKLGKIRRRLERMGIDAIPYAAASTSAAAPAGTFEPGGNFAAALSYGDVTLAGVGTTTVVCNGMALAFGHPFTFEGAVSMGAGTADALTVVDDPTFPPYKLANIDDQSAGTLDQDRLAGVRAVLGPGPARIPIQSTVAAPDAAPDARTGKTDALESEPVPFLGFLHLLYNIDSRFDQVGAGSSAMTWRIEGRDASGDPWSFQRSNVFASEWDISYETAGALEATLYSIFYNEFEEVTFTNVEAEPVRVVEAVDLMSITDLKVSVDGGPYRSKERVRVRPRDRVRIKIVLTSYEDDTNRRVLRESFRVPGRARGEGMYRAYGAGRSEWCFSACSPSKVESFEEMLTRMAEAPTNDLLGTKLRIGGYGSASLRQLSSVVQGRRSLELVVKR